jgi:hypothetical protein
MAERAGNHSLACGQGKRKDPGTRLSFFEVRSDADVGGQEVLRQFSVVKGTNRPCDSYLTDFTIANSLGFQQP